MFVCCEDRLRGTSEQFDKVLKCSVAALLGVREQASRMGGSTCSWFQLVGPPACKACCGCDKDPIHAWLVSARKDAGVYFTADGQLLPSRCQGQQSSVTKSAPRKKQRGRLEASLEAPTKQETPAHLTRRLDVERKTRDHGWVLRCRNHWRFD